MDIAVLDERVAAMSDEFLQDFIDEAQTHIDKAEAAFLDPEKLKTDDETLNAAFRAVHSIKGTAGFFQLRSIVALSHAVENVLGQIKSKKLFFSDDIMDALLLGTDTLKQMISHVETSDRIDISECLKKLELNENQPPVATQQEQKEPQKLHVYNKLVPLVSTAASMQIEDKFRDAVSANAKKGHKVYKIVPENIKDTDAFFQDLRELGCIIDMFTDASESHDCGEIASLLDLRQGTRIRLEILYTSVLEHDLLCDSLALPVSAVVDINFADSQNNHSEYKPIETIRVNVALLEKLMALSGEMVLARNRLLNAFFNDVERETMAGIVKNVDNLTSKIQQEIMLTRMQPINNIFNRFRRLISDLSKKMHKEISLQIDGGDTELDKTMIESLSDPLTHIVRNSADHGIESPRERENLGKPAKGTIKLGASHKGGFVAIEISDDGTGIDVARVKRKAVEQGLVKRDEAERLSDDEVYKLLFLPGFSTASSVSDISGRGVGMDVVRSNVEKLGGTVGITSERNKGTKITLMLPRTLAIIQSLVVGAGGQRFAIPERSIVHVVQGKKLDSIHGARGLRFRGKLLPVVSLAETLKIETENPPSQIVIVRAVNRNIAILVDKIYDTEEILIKPLPRHIGECKYFSGVTIMGDGNIMMIVDIESMAKKMDSPASEDLPDEERENNMLEYQNMMFFKCSGPESYAIDMNMVARVETVNVSDIDEIGTEKYVKIRGKSIRAIRPETYLPVQNLKYESDKMVVIIPNLVRHPIGILVGGIVDNVKAHFALDTEQLKYPGIFGTIIHENHVVLILNIYELFEMADPVNHPKSKREPNLTKRVLIVEDTPFFRHIEAKYLEDAGCSVTVAENGKDALDILKTKSFDAIVSDLIMPIMGGLDFIRQVRGSPKLKDIPAIAVSSMTSDSYVNTALEYGFDAYECKLNKESLLRTLDNVIKSRKGGVSA